MARYTRSTRLIFGAFRCNSSKITVVRNPIRESVSKNDLYTSSFRPNSNSSGSKVSEFSWPIFRNSGFENVLKRNHLKNPFLEGAKRFYHVDRNQIYHFKSRGYNWTKNPRNVFAAVLIGSGIVTTAVYFGSLETVPYTKRTQFVFLSRKFEKEIGDRGFKMVRAQFTGKILPALHPENIRVQRIAREIIGALQKGLSKEQVWSDIDMLNEGNEREAVKALTKNWEVIVVDLPIRNASSLPGGKIIVYTGLLDHLKSDAEVATVLGHEVGHIVARHVAAQLSLNLCVSFLLLIISQFIVPDHFEVAYVLFLALPLSRRDEFEADSIGILLLASAGYDPRVAPQVYEKLAKWEPKSALEVYTSTHPSAAKRAQVLAQSKVMDEALNIYREVEESKGVLV